MRQSTSSTAFAFLLTTAFTRAQINGPIYSSSFTWNADCGPTVACGPAAAGSYGTGYAAANNVTFAAAQPIVGGKGAGCGQCWHLTPQADAYPTDGKTLGTSVVVKINDQCTDPKYCDQLEHGNTKDFNTGYDKQVHFDLCNASGVTNQFFGEIGIGVALGLAQQVDCSQLDNGAFGSGMGDLGQQTATSTADEKSAKQVVKAGKNNAIAVVGGSSSSSSPVAGGQPSTMATTSSSSAIPGASVVAGGGEDDEDDDDDDCDEL